VPHRSGFARPRFPQGKWLVTLGTFKRGSEELRLCPNPRLFAMAVDFLLAGIGPHRWEAPSLYVQPRVPLPASESLDSRQTTLWRVRNSISFLPECRIQVAASRDSARQVRFGGIVARVSSSARRCHLLGKGLGAPTKQTSSINARELYNCYNRPSSLGFRDRPTKLKFLRSFSDKFGPSFGRFPWTIT